MARSNSNDRPKALGIPENEIDETRKALYTWLVEYMQTR
jgi:hypothetical protein